MAAADLASGERRERFGNRRVSLKGIANEEGERKADADKRRKMTAGGGEREKNVQAEKKEPMEEKEQKNEEGKEDIERFLKTSWGRFCKDLRSSQ